MKTHPKLRDGQKKPADRYPTAREVADDLMCFVRGEPICARPLEQQKQVVRDGSIAAGPARARERAARRARKARLTFWAGVVHGAPPEQTAPSEPAAGKRSGFRELWAEAAQGASPGSGGARVKRDWGVRVVSLAVFLGMLSSVLLFVWYGDQFAATAITDRTAAEQKPPVTAPVADDSKEVERLARMRAVLAQQTRQEVEYNLKRATALGKRYQFALADLALVLAEEQARRAADPDLQDEVQKAWDGIQFLKRCDDVRYRKWVYTPRNDGSGVFDPRGVSLRYNDVLREYFGASYGNYRFDAEDKAPRLIDAPRLKSERLAELIAASPLKAELVAALDDWALDESDPSLRTSVLVVARRVDPGPWTDRLRDPAVRADPAALAKLAAEVDLGATTPAALGVLAELMGRSGLDPAPLLTAAREKYPIDFGLAFALGRWHTNRGNHDRAIDPFEIARAIRPDYVPVLSALGAIYLQQKKYAKAITCARDAIDSDPTFADAHAMLGFALQQTGAIFDARAALTKAAQLNRRYASLLAQLPPVPVAPPPRELKR